MTAADPLASCTATSVTLDPVLHFMLFVPSVQNRPMRISSSRMTFLCPLCRTVLTTISLAGYQAPSNAFITPQRGGVVIFNPPSPAEPPADPTSSLSLPSSALAPSFALFEQQLRKLLGVPSAPPTARLQRSGALEPWQVDAMVRARLAEAAKESVETLHAIVKLVDDIPNMRVGKEVQRGVWSALSELEEVSHACRCLCREPG